MLMREFTLIPEPRAPDAVVVVVVGRSPQLRGHKLATKYSVLFGCIYDTSYHDYMSYMNCNLSFSTYICISFKPLTHANIQQQHRMINIIRDDNKAPATQTLLVWRLCVRTSSSSSFDVKELTLRRRHTHARMHAWAQAHCNAHQTPPFRMGHVNHGQTRKYFQ